MKIVVGSDHRGYQAKEQIKAIIAQLGHEAIDIGTEDSNPIDYPDLAFLAASQVSKKEADRAILACGTGITAAAISNKWGKDDGFYTTTVEAIGGTLKVDFILNIKEKKGILNLDMKDATLYAVAGILVLLIVIIMIVIARTSRKHTRASFN